MRRKLSPSLIPDRATDLRSRASCCASSAPPRLCCGLSVLQACADTHPRCSSAAKVSAAVMQLEYSCSVSHNSGLLSCPDGLPARTPHKGFAETPSKELYAFPATVRPP